METKYFDVHVFISRKNGYSLGVKMEVPIGTKVDDDDVIEFASKNKLFVEDGDGESVDEVDEITEEDFKERGWS